MASILLKAVDFQQNCSGSGFRLWLFWWVWLFFHLAVLRALCNNKNDIFSGWRSIGNSLKAGDWP